MEKELFTITAVESNLSEVISAIIRIIEEKSIRIFWFSGDLGAGKTTLIRSLVRELGYSGIVGSPTYGLVNTYDLENTVDLEINATHLNKSTNLDSPNNNNNNNELDLGISDLNRVTIQVNSDVPQQLNYTNSDLNQIPPLQVNSDVPQQLNYTNSDLNQIPPLQVNSDVPQELEETTSGNQVRRIKHKRVHHSDWYRIESIDELYDSGIEEELHEGNDIWLIEWAEMGIDVLESLPVIKIEIEASAPTSPRVYRFVMV